MLTKTYPDVLNNSNLAFKTCSDIGLSDISPRSISETKYIRDGQATTFHRADGERIRDQFHKLCKLYLAVSISLWMEGHSSIFYSLKYRLGTHVSRLSCFKTEWIQGNENKLNVFQQKQNSHRQNLACYFLVIWKRRHILEEESLPHLGLGKSSRWAQSEVKIDIWRAKWTASLVLTHICKNGNRIKQICSIESYR